MTKPLKRLVTKIGRFPRLPVQIQLLFFPVVALLGLAKIAIAQTNFHRIRPFLGITAVSAPRTVLLSADQEQKAIRIEATVRLAARNTPWESNCFAQSVAAGFLMRLCGLPYTLYFGVTKELGTARYSAHAWITAGRVRVTGGNAFGPHTVVGVFVSSLNRRGG